MEFERGHNDVQCVVEAEEGVICRNRTGLWKSGTSMVDADCARFRVGGRGPGAVFLFAVSPRLDRLGAGQGGRRPVLFSQYDVGRIADVGGRGGNLLCVSFRTVCGETVLERPYREECVWVEGFRRNEVAAGPVFGVRGDGVRVVGGGIAGAVEGADVAAVGGLGFPCLEPGFGGDESGFSGGGAGRGGLFAADQRGEGGGRAGVCPGVDDRRAETDAGAVPVCGAGVGRGPVPLDGAVVEPDGSERGLFMETGVAGPSVQRGTGGNGGAGPDFRIS